MNPEEDRDVTKGDRETHERDSVFTPASRSFMVLLRVTGLSTGPGWISLLHTLALFGLQTYINFDSIYVFTSKFTELRSHGEKLFMALIDSNFLGIPNAALWLSLSVTLLYGRRKYAVLLSRVEDVLRDVEKTPELAAAHRSRNRTGECAWAVTVLLATIYLGMKLSEIPNHCGTFTPGCARWLFNEILCYGYVSLGVQVVAIKFVFAGHLIASGFHAVNGGLEAMANDSRPTDIASLRRLGELQRRLSEVFSLLTSDMTAELISVMMNGIIMQILLALYLTQVDYININILSSLIRYFPMVVVTLAGPCETCHLARTRLGRNRDLLLQLEWQRRPQLTSELTLLQRSVTRDLDTLGDLGLYQLRRSTLLGIFSTILTYIIVVVQFKLSETGLCGELVSAGNASNTTEG